MRLVLVLLLATAHLAAAEPDDDPCTCPHPVAAPVILGSAYVTFGSWMYLAWYYHHKPLGYFQWGGDNEPGLFGWAGEHTYAGGADKFGHAWSTMALARGGTELLSRYGGYDHRTSSFISAGMAEALFFFVEIKDGFYYEFSFSDLGGDTAGAVIALLLDNFPRLDEMFDYRVEWWPSPEYRNNVAGGSGANRLNIAEDYSGETYLLAYHLGSIHELGTWSKFVDVTVGFDTRGYKPSPPAGYPAYEHHQDLFLGVSFNAQGFFDWLLAKRAPRARYMSHGLFEIMNVPFSSTYLIDVRNVPSGQVRQGGA